MLLENVSDVGDSELTRRIIDDRRLRMHMYDAD